MRYIVVLFVLFLSTGAWSQIIPFVVKGVIENSDAGKREGGVKVSFIQEGASLYTTTTASSGKYSLKGDFDASKPYKIVFDKAGLVSKFVSFDFSRMNEEDYPAGDFRPVESLDITLFKERENADFSFLKNEPVAKFDWNTRQMQPRNDAVASNNMKLRILKLLADADKDKAAAEINYQKAITAADKFFGEKEYEQALAKYEEALGYKPTEKYPADKIIELDALLQAQQASDLAEKQENEEYYNLIEAADNLRDQDQLEKAVSKYQEALTKKTEQYPKDQITTLKKTIADRKKELENQAKYDDAIKRADSFFKQNSLRAAKDKYTEASSLKPSEQYPIAKLKEIADKMGALEKQEAIKKKYNDAITAADALFSSDNFEEAKAKYKEALTFESSATYPKERIVLCEKAIADAEELKKQEEQISQLLQEGAAAMISKEWELAKTKFTEVLSIEDTNTTAIEKLALVESELAKASDLALQQEKYKELLKEGDEQKSTEKYVEALAKYTEAKAIDATTEVQTRIDEVQTKIKELADNEASEKLKKENYEAAITAADNAFDLASWDEAQKKYREAMTFDASQSYPSERLSKIDELIAEEKEKADKEAEELAKSKAQKEKYNAAITVADNAFNLANWSEAQRKYREAMTFDSSQSYPSERLSKIDELIAEEKAKAYKEAEELANAKAKKASYDVAIKKADGLFSSSKLEDAITKYRDAILIDDTQSYPTEQIVKAEKMIAEKQSKAEQIAAEAKKKEQVEKLLEEGIVLLSNEQLEDAKSKFQEALLIDTSNATATAKINEIDGLITARAELNDKNAKYDDLLSQASKKEISHDYQGAIFKYAEALNIKPNETFPETKIEELKNLIADEAETKTIDEKYQKFMDKGDDLMAHQDYLGAIKEYNNALGVKPSEKEPADKAAEAVRLEKLKDADSDKQYEKIITVAQSKIDGAEYDRAVELLERAKGLRPTDDRPQKMLNRVVLLKKQEAEFISLMNEGNSLGSNGKYEKAILKFEEAGRKKPTAIEPEERIAEMRRLLSDSNSAAQKEGLYKDYIEKGNSNLSSESYVMALTHYQNALSVKPGDIIAQNKINEVQQILDDLSNLKNAELDLKNKFDVLVKVADGSFASGSYIPAKEKYEEALALKPGNSYVMSQIEECVKQERLISGAQAEKEYRKIITAADNNFESETYDKAKNYYERALMFKPGDSYPKEKLAEINAILNPVSIESAKLEDLGDPFDSSIMDGSFILAKAEEKRKALKKNKINRKLEKINKSALAKTTDKMTDHYETSYERITIDAAESNLNQDEIAAALRKARFELEMKDAEDLQYEKSENVGDQLMLNDITESSALEYGEKEAVYTENSSKMNDYKVAQSDKRSEEILSDYETNINSDQELIVIKSKFKDGMNERYDERAEVVEGVKTVKAKATEVLSDISMENNSSLLESQGELDDVQVAREEFSKTENIYAEENNEALKKGVKELAEAHDNEMYRENVKYRENKSVLDKETKLNSEINDIAKDAHDKKIAYVERMDKKAHIANVDGLEGDYDDRLYAEKQINNSYAKVTETSNEEKNKLEESNTALVEVNRTHVAKESAINIGKKEDLYEAQSKLNNVSDKPIEKPIIANSLGDEYPEGVSQESFTRSDSDGLVTTIITRRVVVIEGHANVYVRTQSLNGITYSKNGKPSLSATWSKETQGSHLERHY